MKAKRLHELLRTERRARGVTQSELALAVGCKQSAVSMYEAGHAGTLSKAVVKKMASHLGIDPDSSGPIASGHAAVDRVLKYCPIDECPSNVPYIVRGEIVFRPQMTRMPRGARSTCPWCGEPLLDGCPNTECSAELERDSFCNACSKPYVTSCISDADEVVWVAARQREIRFLSAREGGHADVS